MCGYTYFNLATSKVADGTALCSLLRGLPFRGGRSLMHDGDH